VEEDFLSTLRHELTGFNQSQMGTHLYTTYGDIDKVNIEENLVTMMKPYDPKKTLATSTSHWKTEKPLGILDYNPSAKI
jgi:hypothetical protein